MIQVGIIGATGYVGEELVRLLLNHNKCNIKWLTSKSYTNEEYSNIYGNYVKIINSKCINNNINNLCKDVDVIFVALPHGIISKELTNEILSSTKVIDLGADYRLKDANIYEEWYGVKHGSKELLKKAVYGLCEWNREEIKITNLVANPGCYTTCSILSLAPLLKDKIIENDSIIIDAKSGVSGAGRGLNIGTHFTECNETIKAYKIASHRHTPEIEQELSNFAGEEIKINFTPHLIPMNRGILVTAYAKCKNNISYEKIRTIYEKYYGNEHFIRILPEGVFPETKWVKGSNYIDINFTYDKRTNRIIVVGAIDNLIKGAAGQAVQNMNILFGLEEKTGLEAVPIFPI